jgi:uncharacterized membrane protein
MEKKEDYPIKGEKTRRCEPFWAASARRTTPSKGKSPHARQRHRGHQGHQDHRDPAGVNHVGRRPVGKKERKEDSQSEPFWAASARRNTPSKGKIPHGRRSHQGHRGHRDPAGVNRVGRRPVGEERKGKERKGKERKGKERKGKERKGKERKEDSQSEPFWAASVRRGKRKVTKTAKISLV